MASPSSIGAAQWTGKASAGAEAEDYFGTVALQPQDTYESTPTILLANERNEVAKTTEYTISAESYEEGHNAGYRSLWFQNYGGHDTNPDEAFPITVSCTLQ